MENPISLVNKLQRPCTAPGDHGEESALLPPRDPIRPIFAPAAMANPSSLVNKLQRPCTAPGDHGEESALLPPRDPIQPCTAPGDHGEESALLPPRDPIQPCTAPGDHGEEIALPILSNVMPYVAVVGGQKNPEDDEYDRSESLTSYMTADAVTEYEEVSVDGPKQKTHKRKEGIPVSPRAAKRGRGEKVSGANECLKPDGIAEKIDSRSIAVSSLPYNVKLEDVQSFFAQHGKVNNVRLPKHISDKRSFCGTALVEFADVLEANSVREKKLRFAGAILEMKQKKVFDTEREAMQEAYAKVNTNKNSAEGYRKSLILAFKLKKILADRDLEPSDLHKVDMDTAKNEGATSSRMEWAIGHEEKVPKNAHVREEKSDAAESNAADIQSLNKDSKGPSDNYKETIVKEELGEYFTKFGAVQYVHINKGGGSGYLRFEESKAVEKARALAALSEEGGLIVKGHLVTLEPVSSYKELLQQFSLKKYQKLPIYESRSEGEPRDTKFWCIVKVDSQHLRSLDFHVRKRDAEQDAALVAFEFLMLRDGDNYEDVFTLINKDILFCKAILSEFSLKKKISQPKYSFQHQQGPARLTVFTATVSIGGQEYTGAMAKSKRAAAEKAACVAAKLILDTNDECMLEIFRSKKRFVTATDPRAQRHHQV